MGIKSLLGKGFVLELSGQVGPPVTEIEYVHEEVGKDAGIKELEVMVTIPIRMLLLSVSTVTFP